jgi:hypothetical protein
LLFDNQQQKSLCREVEWKKSTGSSGSLSCPLLTPFSKGKIPLLVTASYHFADTTFRLAKTNQQFLLPN